MKQYVEDTPKKKEYKTLLSNGVYSVTWNSREGRKTMEVTLNEKYIPSTSILSTSGQNQTSNGAEVVRAYSIDRGGWRSFNINDVYSYRKLRS